VSAWAWVGRAAGATALALAVSVAPSTATKAEAYSGPHVRTRPISTFSYTIGGATIKVPTGCFFTLNVNYNEKTAGVGNARMGTDCIGLAAMNPWWFCNRWVTLNFYDNKGRKYYRWASKKETNCDTFDSWKMPYSVRGKYGKAIARFYVNGDKEAQVTLPIHS
jgi:hypothetical protein